MYQLAIVLFETTNIESNLQLIRAIPYVISMDNLKPFNQNPKLTNAPSY